ncbi:hypothetical protein O3P69_003271 [Scylla paramamosain]|uniref:Doublecortin domain-containing protein n=1 Tax=Scylla paramamosain TaxID=85552 RepID=A0AAW0UNE1_SCYPA
MGPSQEKGEYEVSGPQGTDLYQNRQVALPPLSHTPASEAPSHASQGGGSLRQRRSRAKSVLYPYIHGQTRGAAGVQAASRGSSATAMSAKSKDDSRIQYEYELNVEEQEEPSSTLYRMLEKAGLSLTLQITLAGLTSIRLEVVAEAATAVLLVPKAMTQDRWRALKVRFFRNGDRYYPGYEYVFQARSRRGQHGGSMRQDLGQDRLVVGFTGVCLINGARYIFGLDGRRRYRIEELEDGESYVASSDRKFVFLTVLCIVCLCPALSLPPPALLPLPPLTSATHSAVPPSLPDPAIWTPLKEARQNLAYGRQRPDWNPTNVSDSVRAGSPLVREVTKKSSAESNKSGNSKPGSREGRTIKVINNLDHSQERTVLVNMKTINLWEEVVKDLGRMFRLTGHLHLFTTWGQEVKSFSQFKNDFANVDTFYVSVNDTNLPVRPTHQSHPASNGGSATSSAVARPDASAGGGDRRRSLSEEDEKRGVRTPWCVWPQPTQCCGLRCGEGCGLGCLGCRVPIFSVRDLRCCT